MYFAQMALHQHFGYTCSSRKVAIYLEWRMRIKEVWIGAASAFTVGAGIVQQMPDECIGMIAIQQTRPPVDLPSTAPAGAGISSYLQRFLCGCKELRRIVLRDLAARMQTKQVRYMAVLRVCFCKLFIPFQ